jgi:hypothetical protein
MTPKEKAKELVDKFMLRIIFNIKQNIEASVIESAKQCALIAVDEIYYGLYNYLKDTNELQNADREFAYWENVKKEIEKF